MHALLTAAVLTMTAVQADTSYLYKTHFIRAAPGEILELVDVLQDRMSFYDAAGEPAPFMMRHSQGDHWDLQILALEEIDDHAHQRHCVSMVLPHREFEIMGKPAPSPRRLCSMQ